MAVNTMIAHTSLSPNYKDLILVGGGHAHALVIKMWAMKPIAGVRLTLISPLSLTPYSGMLPGLIAGDYNFEEAHIDLTRLCQYANVRFIQEKIDSIDLDDKKILFSQRPSLGFDVISINTGISPKLDVEGAQNNAIPVKPIARFYPHWLKLVNQLEHDPQSEPFHLSVVGGGAAGVELIFAFQQAIANNVKITRKVQLHLVHKGSSVPEGYPLPIQKHIAQALKEHGIQLHCGNSVQKVCNNLLILEQNKQIKTDTVFWCTQANAANWPDKSGLNTDINGFIATNQFLQSSSHDFVFAAGDIAQQVDTPRPRAGVYAVRQGPVLFENLCRSLLRQPLKPYHPQKAFLSLLICGKKRAVGCKPGSLFPVIKGQWVWHWKRRIDMKFMAMFSLLPPVKVMSSQSNHRAIIDGSDKQTPKVSAMRCGGCGAKVGATTLQRVMGQLNPVANSGVLVGLKQSDDAAVINIPNDKLLVQSVDVFRALLDDPYTLGKIAAEHALSDLFAMNATPHSALAIVTLPYASEALVERDLMQLMSGAIDVLNRHNCTLIGGHTSEGAELSIGFSVNGLTTADLLLRKTSPTPGHQLILTQPLGTGALFAAHNQFLAKGPWIDEAIQWMLTSNKKAAEIFYQMGASACTDITGFGLLGHLIEMLKPVQPSSEYFQATLNLSSLPSISGAKIILSQGITSSLHPDNMRVQKTIADFTHWSSHENYPLLFDPQTSGGLLASIPDERVLSCLNQLKAAGYYHAVVIGEIRKQPASFEKTKTIKIIDKN